jgi:hypothetical protein
VAFVPTTVKTDDLLTIPTPPNSRKKIPMTLLERLLEKYERDLNLKIVEMETRQTQVALREQIHQIHVKLLFAQWLGMILGTIINPNLISVRPGSNNCNRLEQDRWFITYLDRPTGGFLTCESAIYLSRKETGDYILNFNLAYNSTEPRWSANYNNYTTIQMDSFLEALAWLRSTYQTKEKL